MDLSITEISCSTIFDAVLDVINSYKFLLAAKQFDPEEADKGK